MRPMTRPLLPARRFVPVPAASRTDWLRASIISGFIATFSMTVSIAVAWIAANGIGESNGTTVQRWFDALSHNELTRQVGDRFFVGMLLNLGMGLVWALIYARAAEPALHGPGWSRGALFSILPFILTITIFFPLAGIGLFAKDIHAGILPVAGALILHLIYGAVLGSLYAIEGGAWLTDAEGEAEAAESAERGAVIGIIAGTILGFAGGWFLAPSMDSLASQPVIGIAGALSGAAIGILIGSLLGMKVVIADGEDGNLSHTKR